MSVGRPAGPHYIGSDPHHMCCSRPAAHKPHHFCRCGVGIYCRPQPDGTHHHIASTAQRVWLCPGTLCGPGNHVKRKPSCLSATQQALVRSDLILIICAVAAQERTSLTTSAGAAWAYTAGLNLMARAIISPALPSMSGCAPGRSAGPEIMLNASHHVCRPPSRPSLHWI